MGAEPPPHTAELALGRSVVLDFGSTLVQCVGPCPRVGALDAPSAHGRDDRARDAGDSSISTRSTAPDVSRKTLDSRARSALAGGAGIPLQRPLPEAAPTPMRGMVPQDSAGTAAASPESSPRGPRPEAARPMARGSAPVDYAEQLQNRWLEIAASMPKIVEDTILMGGVPIYRPAGGDKNTGVVLRPGSPVGLAVGVKFH